MKASREMTESLGKTLVLPFFMLLENIGRYFNR